MDDRYMNTNFFLVAILAISAGNSLATTDPPIACNLKALTLNNGSNWNKSASMSLRR